MSISTEMRLFNLNSKPYIPNEKLFEEKKEIKKYFSSFKELEQEKALRQQQLLSRRNYENFITKELQDDNLM